MEDDISNTTVVPYSISDGSSGSTVLPHKVWQNHNTGGLIGRVNSAIAWAEAVPTELHDEVIDTREFKKRRVAGVKCTSEAFKRAMFKDADQEAGAVLRAAARMGIGQHQYVDVKTADYVPERYSQKLIADFYNQITLKGAI